MIGLPVIKPPPRGNDKLGPVLTESRETGPTCPSTCPFRRSGQCYSIKGERYHPGPISGWRARDRARHLNRKGWRTSRARQWAKEALAGRPVRFLVHGDLMDPRGPRGRIDREFLADVLRVARRIRNFRGWGYSHAWKQLPPRTLRHLRQAGITIFASCHSEPERKEATSRGFRAAIVSRTPARGYQGPGTVAGALVCPHQRGRVADCLSCRYCWGPSRGDLVLLAH